MPQTFSVWTRAYLNQELGSGYYVEMMLMLLSIAAGIVDATTYPDYGVFASNQTGNTALLAVGALSLENADRKVNLQLVSTSLGIFIAGSFVMGYLGNKFGRLRRGWLLGSTTLQMALTLIAAALRRWYASNSSLAGSTKSVIALLAFQSAGQISLARTINVPEVSTAMVTTAYVDFFVDKSVLARDNRPRMRRIAFLLSFIAGCFIGAVGYRYEGPAFSLLLAGIMKVFACVMVLLSRADSKSEPK